MKNYIRKLVLKLPGGGWLWSKLKTVRAYQLLKKAVPEAKNPEAIFEHHYKYNYWGDQESASGSGSTLAYTENIRQKIPELMVEFKFREILDAPCGDYNWMRKVVWKSNVQYTGGDIVRSVVERNKSVYQSASVNFLHLDIVNGSLPHADLWLCRDCLFHLSDVSIFKALHNFLDSGIPYLLTSSHPESDLNNDIPDGSFRLLNLLLPPFSLPKPIREIEDWVEGFPVRYLGLWDRDAIEVALGQNKKYHKAIHESHMPD